MTRLAILALRPLERYWAWSVKRAYRKGKYKYSPNQGKRAVTTKKV